MRRFLLLTLLVGCADPPTPSVTLANDRRQDPFEVGPYQAPHRWSVLWEMGKTGEFTVCLGGVRSAVEAQTVRDNTRAAVAAWVGLLNWPPPDDTYPAWPHARVAVRLRCTPGAFRIDLTPGQTTCWPEERRINLTHGAPAPVVARELGHAMGLLTTHGTQPIALMRGHPKVTDDDHQGVWGLWRYLMTGQMSCGPGYRQVPTDPQGPRGFGCAPGSCLYRCQDHGFRPNQCSNGWQCRGQCLTYVDQCN